MKSFNIQKSLLAAAVSALVLGFAAPAMADDTAPVFTIDPTAIGVALAKFDANQMAGTSSELLKTVGNTHSGSGWIQFTGFALNGSPVGGGVDGVTVQYKLFATFDLKDTFTGPANAPGMNGTVTQLDFKFYADVGLGNTFTPANALTSTPASYVDGGAPDILLGVGSLISGVDGIDAKGGAFFNSDQLFAVCTGAGTGTVQGMPAVGNIGLLASACQTDAGSKFFAAPVPFYGLAFDSFNNTSQGVRINGDLLSINQAVGNVDFNRIPEPGSLALLGLGLMGIGATLRRRSV